MIVADITVRKQAEFELLERAAAMIPRYLLEPTIAIECPLLYRGLGQALSG